MPDRLDFESARDLIEGIAPTDTWDEAVQRAEVESLMALDTDDSTERPRWRPSNGWLVAVAACLLAVVVLAAVVAADRQSVDTAPAESPTTECTTPTQPRVITSGGQMRNRFAAPLASAATALMLLGACDDGPTTIAKGEDIELVGGDADSLGGQTLQIDVQEEGGEVTGQFVVTNIVNTVECADTDTEGFVVLGGRVTTTDPDAEFAPAIGDLTALVIKDSDPDGVNLYGNDVGAETCAEMIESIPPADLTDDGPFIKVMTGDDIETG